MIEKDIITEYVFPVAVAHAENAENAGALTRETELQITLVEPRLAMIRKGGFVVLDFGRETGGSVRILAKNCGAKLRLRLGESMSEAYSELGEHGSTNDHALRDGEFFVPDLSDQTYFDSGFRYLRIDAVEKDVTLKAVVAVSKRVGYERVGSFRHADERLTRIFDVAADTVTLCMRGGMLWDGIKRDRLVWIGDMYPEFLAGMGLYRETGYLARCVDFARETTPLPEWMNTMPSYSLWWIISLYEYFLRTRDEATLARNIDYLEGLTELYDGFVTEEGRITTPGLFLDWQSAGSADEEYGVRAIAVIAAVRAAELLNAFGKNAAHARSIKAKLERVDGQPTIKKQAAALSLLAGLKADPRLLTKGGASGMSTFTSWAILEAAHDFVSPRAALDMCRDYYGAMLDKGATTFFEDFDYDAMKDAAPITRLARAGEKDVHRDFGAHCYKGYRHSLCHGWSAGVIDYLFSRVAGIRVPESLADDTVTIKSCPGLGDVQGVFPVLGGSVSVSVRGGKTEAWASGGVKLRVEKP